jgi:hypothetical protein
MISFQQPSKSAQLFRSSAPRSLNLYHRSYHGTEYLLSDKPPHKSLWGAGLESVRSRSCQPDRAVSERPFQAAAARPFRGPSCPLVTIAGVSPGVHSARDAPLSSSSATSRAA